MIMQKETYRVVGIHCERGDVAAVRVEVLEDEPSAVGSFCLAGVGEPLVQVVAVIIDILGAIGRTRWISISIVQLAPPGNKRL